MGKLIDMVGRRFGRLVVAGRASPPKGETRAFWQCGCDCGAECVVSGRNLRSEISQSCGCIVAEKASEWMNSEDFKRHRVNLRHGHKRRGATSRTYKIWLGMKARCERPKNVDFHNYGAKGISVCAEWRGSFEQFLADMGEVPSRRHTIDRIDPRGNYQLGNCRWVAVEIQGAENKTSLRPITVNGLNFHSTLAAARHFGVGRTTIMYRLSAGMSIEDALSETRRPARRSRESYLTKTHPDRN